MSNHSIISQSSTIAALATANGRAGIAVVRVSGPHVPVIIDGILRTQITPRLAHYLPFHSSKNEVIDVGIAIFFPNPNSFTGEDVVELHCHGGPVVVDRLLQRILQLGACIAKPGEFSERAFLNGKIDLAQAEGIADLINASSEAAARSAMRSLQGEFSTAVTTIKDKIIILRMHLESAIDFSDEEIEFLEHDHLQAKMHGILEELTELRKKSQQGSLLRDGIRVVIAGQPNVGKSSLLNLLSGDEVAIVTDIAGTTRDVLRNEIILDGMPVHVIDTAGLRDSDDIVEREGIRRAYSEIERADLVLYLLDATETLKDDVSADFHAPMIYVRNKIDLTRESANFLSDETTMTVSMSVKTREGLAELKKAIQAKVGFVQNMEGVFLARRRHLDALSRTQELISTAAIQLAYSKAIELAAEDLRLAQLALSEITGEFTADDLLGEIFSNFCIGK